MQYSAYNLTASTRSKHDGNNDSESIPVESQSSPSTPIFKASHRFDGSSQPRYRLTNIRVGEGGSFVAVSTNGHSIEVCNIIIGDNSVLWISQGSGALNQ